MNCTTKNCAGKILAKDLCTKCYYRVKRGGTAEIPKKYSNVNVKCKFSPCDRPQKAKGLCSTHYRAKQRSENPQLRAQEVQRTKQWREKNPEKHAGQQTRKHEKYKERDKAYIVQWKRDNWDTYKHYLHARKQRVKQATPKWADIKQIEEFYRNRPEGYHVDHREPLNGKNVCGLHVIDNLQYLTKSENLKKSNKS